MTNREITRDLYKKFLAARAALIRGVSWDGSYENISGCTLDEAIQLTVDFLVAFDEWVVAGNDSDSEG